MSQTSEIPTWALMTPSLERPDDIVASSAALVVSEHALAIYLRYALTRSQIDSLIANDAAPGFRRDFLFHSRFDGHTGASFLHATNKQLEYARAVQGNGDFDADLDGLPRFEEPTDKELLDIQMRALSAIREAEEPADE